MPLTHRMGQEHDLIIRLHITQVCRPYRIRPQHYSLEFQVILIISFKNTFMFVLCRGIHEILAAGSFVLCLLSDV